MSEKAEERLEAEMRRVLIDFSERFFLWCALFRPVEGSRGMRAETLLTRFGKVRVLSRFVIGNKERPGFLGRFGRRTKACEDAVAEEGCDRSSFRRAESVSRARGIDISASTIRKVTLRRGKEEYDRPAPTKVDLAPKGAIGGKRRRTALTMVVSPDGTCVPCAKKDLEGVKGRDGKPARTPAAPRGETYPLSIFLESEQRRIAADFGTPRLPPAVKRAINGAEKAMARSRKRAEKGLCTKEESEAFCAKSSAALRTYLDKQVESGTITPAERKAIGR